MCVGRERESERGRRDRKNNRCVWNSRLLMIYRNIIHLQYDRRFLSSSLSLVVCLGEFRRIYTMERNKKMLHRVKSALAFTYTSQGTVYMCCNIRFQLIFPLPSLSLSLLPTSLAHLHRSSSHFSVWMFISIVLLALVTSVTWTPPLTPPVRFYEYNNSRWSHYVISDKWLEPIYPN